MSLRPVEVGATVRGVVGLVAIAMVVAACGAPAAEDASATITSPLGFDIPDVDLRQSGVPLDEIYFDTFIGAAVPLSTSAQALRESLLDAIPPIDEPSYATREEADGWLDAEEVVVGYSIGRDARAYPARILNSHEIVHDDVGGIPIAVTFCPLCGSGVVYDRRFDHPDGRSLTLEFSNTSALYENDLVMVDRQSGSYWWQVAGLAIVGPFTGERLLPLPAETTTWESWRTRHPDTLVLSRDTGFSTRTWSPYGPPSLSYPGGAFAGYEDRIDAGRFIFPVSETALDDRYAASQRIIGVVIRDEVVGVPMIGAGVASFDVSGVPYVALVDPPAARAFRDPAGGITSEAGRFVSPDGLGWSVDGLATDGSQLDPVPTVSMFWFAFAAAHPSALIVEPD